MYFAPKNLKAACGPGMYCALISQIVLPDTYPVF